jgi:phosphate transport system permease protein
VSTTTTATGSVHVGQAPPRNGTTASTTTRPVRPPESAARESRRVVSGARASDLFAVVGAVLGSGGLTWLLFTHLAPFSGLLGWLVVWYLAFLLLYAVVVSFDESGQAVKDRLAAAVIRSFAGLLLLALGFVIVYVVVRGLPALVHLNLYLQDLTRTGPLQPLSSGGVLHGIAGTLIEIAIALVITVPAGLTCAVFLNEFPGRYARLVRTVVEAMTALPSVVAGLFIYSTYVLVLGFPRSGLAAALALGVMMLPIIVRAADVVLRLVPGNLTEASLALGASKWRTVWHVTLPTARSGLATAVILGTARGIGETSPVLLTAGYGNATNTDPREGPMVSLPLLAYTLRNIPSDAMIARAFGAASILLVIVLVLFFTARTIGGRGAGQLTARQQRRRERQSHQDAARLAAAAHQRLAEAAPPIPMADPAAGPPLRRTPAPPLPPAGPPRDERPER